MMKSQKEIKLKKQSCSKGKRMAINEINRQNKIMLSYCLKCKKYRKRKSKI